MTKRLAIATMLAVSCASPMKRVSSIAPERRLPTPVLTEEIGTRVQIPLNGTDYWLKLKPSEKIVDVKYSGDTTLVLSNCSLYRITPDREVVTFGSHTEKTFVRIVKTELDEQLTDGTIFRNLPAFVRWDSQRVQIGILSGGGVRIRQIKGSICSVRTSDEGLVSIVMTDRTTMVDVKSGAVIQ